MLLESVLLLLAGLAGAFGQVPSPSAPASNFSYISGKGSYLLAIDRTGVVHRLNGTTWVALPAPTLVGNPNIPAISTHARSVGASPDGWHHMCTKTGEPFRFNPNSNTWEYTNNVLCKQINARNKDNAAMIKVQALRSNQGVAVTYTATGILGTGSWNLLGVTTDNNFDYLEWVSIGKDGEIWTIANEGRVFRYNSAADRFDGIPILNALRLDVRNASYATVVTPGCTAWTFKSGTWAKWYIVSGCPVQTTSTSSNDYYLDERGHFGSRH
ncbi:uncharacterized protein LOC129601115 [Paramacrobiotus metropolitanus]|uniref:uncharacterized protein LOC129601115 n=1 Tax=Paramacrobiotus metropolitanus TaxID=2943436 RepID=UPI00244597F2|nr:uncharacterized protein LOC129601115 [Paramacrobiotus metropolitanus]XP_055355818.1 uncharacterized protein LOC129601115 [Paramacrobiotus metropolitanus]XP_055355819.1 uncharacterized protein LOC129601115 [Paramacrobiotus metropolitanus]